MKNKYQVANNLRSLRLFNGLTQEQIASHLHVSRSAYCQYELGKRVPDFSTLLSLSTLYSVSIDSLLSEFCSPIPFQEDTDCVSKVDELSRLYLSLSGDSQIKVENLLYSLYLTGKKEPFKS